MILTQLAEILHYIYKGIWSSNLNHPIFFFLTNPQSSYLFILNVEFLVI
jgi:hypothetical protein